MLFKNFSQAFLLTTALSLVSLPSWARVTPQAPNNTSNRVLIAEYVCTTQGSNVNIRSGPGKQYRVVRSIPTGAPVGVLGVTNGRDGVRWFKVSAAGVVGWMRGDYVCS
jgi:uncharacterized protein YgiM (DUF1202 family)